MVDLIRINLNKGESHASKVERLKERGRWVIFGVIIIVLIGMNVGAYFYNQKMDTLIENREQKIEEVQTKLRALKQEGMNLSKNDINSLYQLEEERTFWAAKLQALAQNVANDMALTEVEFQHGRFIMSGITRIYPGEREFDIVNNFTEELQYDPVFSKQFGRVKLLSYSRENVRSQDIVSFQIEAELPAGGVSRSRSQTQREPIVVGGDS
ncbi:MAG: hypothetical protein MAGBODY4_01201 [Candidatus Marinimicrobia bacterium]|nr:hypothetical protein [Candidatus Neomarinimicrobiota bacterium]